MERKRIESKKGLTELLRRYQEAGASEEDINTVKGCINEGLAMIEEDYYNSPKEIRKLWNGLK